MAADAFNFTCPHCNQATTVTGPNQCTQRNLITVGETAEGYVGYRFLAIRCPNPLCNELTLKFYLISYSLSSIGNWSAGADIESWSLRPESTAKPQPDYIPAQIRQDYLEACRIRDLSPKAAATLARRCLQGMIRDFWDVKNLRTLKQEIDVIRDRIDTDVWAAIQAVRNVGNIGAHMEQDVDLIVDIEPEEAELLIGLIERLFREWYVARYERKKSMNDIVMLANRKASQINNGTT